MIHLRSVEPHFFISLTPELLTRNLLVTGSTGSGKTTSGVRPLLRQLIMAHRRRPGRRPGLLILDAKADDTVPFVRQLCREAGRSEDLRILGPGGNVYYDILHGFTLDRFDRLDETVLKFLLGSRDMGAENQYWTETRRGLLGSALTLLRASSPGNLSLQDALDFFDAWWFGPLAAEPKRVAFVRQVVADKSLDPQTVRRLQVALQDVESWKQMDVKLRETHKSTILNLLRPLSNPAAASYFSGCDRRFQASDLLDGGILLVSVNAQVPGLAQLLFRLVKQDCFAEISARGYSDPKKARLVMVVADEYSLYADQSDGDFLATCRSRFCGLVAVLQSLAGLDRRIGYQAREALLANFCSTLHFASHEPELDQYVARLMGQRERDPELETELDLNSGLHSEFWRSSYELVAPPGALGRLCSHRAYVRLADGRRYKEPIWLEPLFLEQKAPAAEATAPAANALPQAVMKIMERSRPTPAHLDTLATGMLCWGSGSGHRLWLTPSVVEGLLQMLITRESRDYYIERIRRVSKIVGLGAVPDCWLPGLHAWLARRADVRGVVATASVRSGILFILDENAKLEVGTATTPTLGHLALVLYPCLWRPANRRHLMQLWKIRPDLHPEIQSLPQWSSWFPAPGLSCQQAPSMRASRPRTRKRKR